MLDFSNTIFRWSIGQQNTVTLSDFDNDESFLDLLCLAKLSIISFQRHFPGAKFIVLYNGRQFDEFVIRFNLLSPRFVAGVEYIDQSKIDNPYRFAPVGVWWKWVPFRLDINKHEIAVDTDIVCINRPQTWYDWFDRNEQLLVAPERFQNILINTCGDLYKHPVLKNKQSVNCGVVGQKAGHNYGDRFFEIANTVNVGQTHNSLFITEQGAINVWIYSLELDGIKHHVLDFSKNAWMRDFIYFLKRGIAVETIHAVTWYKKLVKALNVIFEKKVFDDLYDNSSFISDVVAASTHLDLDVKYNELAKYTICRQLGPANTMQNEIHPV